MVQNVGSGSFSKVYKAKDLLTDSNCAMKVIGRNQSDLILNLVQLKVFLNEVKILKLLDHPNIAKYLTHFVTDHALIIITEYYEESLLSVIIEQGYLSEQLTRNIIA